MSVTVEESMICKYLSLGVGLWKAEIITKLQAVEKLLPQWWEAIEGIPQCRSGMARLMG